MGLLLLFLVIQVASGLISVPITKKTTRLAAEGPGDWQTLAQVAAVTSPWLSVHCERLLDDKGQTLDYWRVEKDHSVIVLTLHRDTLVFPKKQYRPGVKKKTLDFAGGRSSREAQPEDAVAAILKRELDIDLSTDVLDLKPLNERSGWLVNSSFSNQELFGFVAVLRDDLKLDTELLHSKTYSVNDMDGIDELLQNELICLQCRAVLMEYLMNQRRL